MQFHEFSYSNPDQPRLKQWVIRLVEGMSGRDQYFRLYDIWRRDIVPSGDRVFSRMLDLIDIRLNVADCWPPERLPSGPLVIIANHPFGIGDGVAILALAERIGRPFKVLINNDLLKISEMQPYALPISFDETKDAVALNLKTKREAVRLLKQGYVIVVFPAGGVATSERAFGPAKDLPWKMFPARLIQAAQASVIPMHFAGQNGRIFHIASKISVTLRLSLLVREFKRLSGKTIGVKIGNILPWAQLAPLSDRKELLQLLYDSVFGLEQAPELARKRLVSLRRLRR